ncbi:MAG: glycosyltransferase family 4 protein [Bacteroidales bacterium]|nr:glycosyltransferase family 4 protein [Bacteroidales bacterium]
MKVGFYLQNEKIKETDCSQPLKGNPGIGGTEYMFIAIPFCLSLLDKKDCSHEIILFAENINNLPKEINCIKVSNNKFSDVIKEQNIDIIILRYSYENLLFSKKHLKDTKIIMWAHNFITRQELTILSNTKNIISIVCVGTEQLHFYRDHKAFNKSVVIFNGYPVKHFIEQNRNQIKPFNQRKNEVTFLGNIVEYKGFHILAKAWKKVLKEIPDAHLNVIGGGKLYDRTMKLGKWGIAEENYEQSFMPFLMDNNGKILPSVTFWGVLGHEKEKIMNITKVGVPNPSGVSETFCIAALELQLWGSIITTINYGGFKDTVHRTGILYKSVDDLADSIIEQLKTEHHEYDEIIKFAKQFDFKTVTKDWVKLFNTIEKKQSVLHILKPAKIPQEHKLKEINRKIKSHIPFGYILPTFMLYNSLFYRIKKIFGINK